jgi:hypothetical protein
VAVCAITPDDDVGWLNGSPDELLLPPPLHALKLDAVSMPNATMQLRMLTANDLSATARESYKSLLLM